jgi:hypothetical protein
VSCNCLICSGSCARVRVRVRVVVCAHRYGADAHWGASAQRVSESLEEIELALSGTRGPRRVGPTSVQGPAGARAMYRLALPRRRAPGAAGRRLLAILADHGQKRAGGRRGRFRRRAATACQQIINEW